MPESGGENLEITSSLPPLYLEIVVQSNDSLQTTFTAVKKRFGVSAKKTEEEYCFHCEIIQRQIRRK